MIPADASEHLLTLLWQASWQGAVFAVAVGLLCCVLRIPAAYRALLWFLVGLKLVGGFLWLLCFGSRVTVPIRVSTPPVLADTVAASTPSPAALAPVLLALWMVGVLLCLFVILRRARTTYNRMCSAISQDDPAVAAIVEGLAKRIGIAPPRIPAVPVIATNSDGPQVTLLGAKPVVVFPEPLLPPSPTALSRNDLQFVVAHELAHVQRGDLWAGLLFAITHSLFFFHPAAAWAKREWEAAREEACDLLALQACSDGDRDTTARYGALLLRLGSGFAPSSEGSASIASSPFNALRRRLTHLDTWKETSTREFSFASLLVVVPILVTLLLPVELRWVAVSGTTSSTKSMAHQQPKHIKAPVIVARTKKPRFTPFQKILSVHREARHESMMHSIPTATPTVLQAVVAVQPALRAVVESPITPVIAPRRIVSKPTTQTVPVVAPELNASAIMAPVTTAELVVPEADTAPAPVLVEPTSAPSSAVAYSPTVTGSSDGIASSGTSSAVRTVETSTARPSGFTPLVRPSSTGHSVPSIDVIRPTITLPVPTPIPSPSPNSNPMDAPTRDGELTHSPRR